MMRTENSLMLGSVELFLVFLTHSCRVESVLSVPKSALKFAFPQTGPNADREALR